MVPLQVIKIHLERLKEKQTPIRIHGNGFIQIEPVKNNRIHIWSPAIPAQPVYTGIHDHKADFVSAIWYGQIQNRIYKDLSIKELRGRIPADAVMRVWESQASNRFEGDEDTKLVARDAWIVGGMNPTTETYNAGNAYFFPRYSFHETVVKRFAITGMSRFNQDDKHAARVLCRVDQEPSNEFDKHGFEAEAVWDIVFSLIRAEIKFTTPKSLRR